MNWPWSKPKPKDVPEVPVVSGDYFVTVPVGRKKAEITIEEDWVPNHSDWRRELLCHCGRYSPLNFVGACPKCGHHDKFKPVTWRDEWEYSSSRHREKLNDCIFAWVGYPDVLAPWNRNFKRVDWAPEHCPIKEDE